MCHKGQEVVSPAAYPGVKSAIPACAHTFVKNDHEIINSHPLLLLVQYGLL